MTDTVDDPVQHLKYVVSYKTPFSSMDFSSISSSFLSSAKTESGYARNTSHSTVFDHIKHQLA